MNLHLVSHNLCPYVQRVAISLTEKGVPFKKTYIDLQNKPDWFLDISPLGKTPVLLVDGIPIFESGVILEFLEDSYSPSLHPKDIVQKASHRAWIEFGSSILGDIARLYNAKSEEQLFQQAEAISSKFCRLESEIDEEGQFDGLEFSLVDVVYGPIFRYFDVFETFIELPVFSEKGKVSRWRKRLQSRDSIKSAVTKGYSGLLMDFLLERDAALSRYLIAV